MSPLPSGTVTFLYTDIEGSTRLWELHRESMPDVLKRNDEIWRTAVAANNGQIYRITGDGYCAAFSNAAQALNSAAAGQLALYEEEWGAIEQLRVRAIIHTGSAVAKDGDYVGGSLNTAGRLLSVCHGGQILVSQAAAELVRHKLPAGSELIDLGQHRFRDIADPQQIYQLSIDGLPISFPALSSSAEVPNNLPQQLTSFIGRQEEDQEIRSLLQHARQVTIVGPGGTGKTRLALKVAEEIKAEYPDGVWLVQLASITDPNLVNRSLASVLSVPEQPGRSLVDSLITYLKRKELLIVLDNCEHLVEACARTATALLQACPRLTILSSSREGLGVAGESVYPLQPLSLPDAGEADTGIAEHESVRLFIERALSVQPGFRLTEANAGAVADICRRLDGIPLAIELAAARTRHLSPQQINARLDQSFRLLTGGSRAALPRQQTLRALIDWSYDLLSEPERTLFRQIAVFHGGWTLEAAEAICVSGNHESERPDSFDLLDLTSALVEKSMVAADMGGEEPRFRLLETMRQYGLEKLKDAGEAEMIRDRHLAYFTALALQTETPNLRTIEIANIDKLKAEHDNLSSALEWSSSGEQTRFLNFAAALGAYWTAIGYSAEGQKWLGMALSNIITAPDAAARRPDAARIARASFYEGLLAFVRGSYQAAQDALEIANEVARRIKDDNIRANALTLLAPTFIGLGRMEDALETAEEAVSIAQHTGDELLIGRAMSAYGGTILWVKNDLPTAKRNLEESVLHVKNAKDMSFLTTQILILTDADIHSGDLDAAWQRAQEGMEAAIASRNLPFQQIFRTKFAEIHRLRGEFAPAVSIYSEAVVYAREFGNLGSMARCIECLAYIDIQRAQELSASQRTELLRRASYLLGTAEMIREIPDVSMPQYEQAEYQQAKALLFSSEDENKALETSWAKGRAQTIEEAEDFVVSTFLSR